MASAQRVAIHVRVSTQDQSCELQRRELTAYAHARSAKVLACPLVERARTSVYEVLETARCLRTA